MKLNYPTHSPIGYPGGSLLLLACVLGSLFFAWHRPLGATIGDYIDKPLDKGGLDFSRPVASLVLAVLIVALILILPQRAGQHPGEGSGESRE